MVYRVTSRGLARRQERRTLLLTAARKEFGENGYHATSVPKIVESANSSIGAFYVYFKSKEDIFVALLRLIEQELSAALNSAQASAGNGVVAQMQAAIEALVGYLVGHPTDARILLLEAPSLSGEIYAAWRAIIESHTRSVERALKTISAPVKLPDLATAATCWVGAVHEAVLRWLEKSADERPSAELLARTIVKFNLNGIGAATQPAMQRRA